MNKDNAISQVVSQSTFAQMWNDSSLKPKYDEYWKSIENLRELFLMRSQLKSKLMNWWNCTNEPLRKQQVNDLMAVEEKCLVEGNYIGAQVIRDIRNYYLDNQFTVGMRFNKDGNLSFTGGSK